MFRNNGTKIINNIKLSQPPRKLPLDKNNSFLIAPFELIAGYITSTEFGIQQKENISITSYATFQRVFTGLENIIARWEGAYNIYKKGTSDKFLTKEYKVGRTIKAFIPDENKSASFQPSNISGDFLTQFSNDTITAIIYDELQEEDLFKLFIITQLKDTRWLYIADATKYYWNGKYQYTEITFESLNDKVAKSGRAIEEFIQNGAPGEGYAYPSINSLGEVKLDISRTKDIPTTSLQVEMSGPAAFNTIFAMGRPTITGQNGNTLFNDKIEAPRKLLPLRMLTPQPSATNTRPSAETDFYVGMFKPTQWEHYKDWKSQMANSYDLSQRNQYEGILIGTGNTSKLSELRQSNPLGQGGTHDYEMWDPNWTLQYSNKVLNTSADKETGDNITLNGYQKINELLAHNVFAYSPYVSLPMSVQQNTTWRLKDIPIIGGFLTKLTLGIPLGWSNNAIKLAMPSVDLIMPASIAEYGNVLKGDGTPSDDVFIPLETFTTERKDEATEYSGINATGTILKVELTHRFKKTIKGVEYKFDTKDLGQIHPTIDDEGTTIVFDDPNNKPVYLQWDGTCVPTDRGNVPGYVIDMPHFKALAKLDYRLSFYSNDYPIWSGTYQTQSQFTGNIRDWDNTIKMSNWKETNNETIDYPAIIVDPPLKTNTPKIHLTDIAFPTNKYAQENGLGRYELIQGITTGYKIWGTNTSKPIEQYFLDGVGNTLPKDQEINIPESIPAVISKSFDLKPLGGTTYIKNEYKEITFNVVDGRISGTNKPLMSKITIDIDHLITSGSEFKQVITDNPFVEHTYWLGNDNSIFAKFDYVIKALVANDQLKISITTRDKFKWSMNPMPFHTSKFHVDSQLATLFGNKAEGMLSASFRTDEKPLIQDITIIPK